MAGKIYVGVGGWTFEPWRGVFYPEGLVHKRELEYASRHLTSIEINGTYYSSFKPASWAKWRDETPDGFVFAVKASRFCTNRQVAGRGGRIRSGGSSARESTSWATGWGRSTGSSWAPRSSTPRISKPSSSCCRARSASCPCATPWRSVTRASRIRAFYDLWPASTTRRSSIAARRGLPRDRRADGRLHLRPPDAQPRRRSRPATSRPTSTNGPSAPRPGPSKGDAFVYFISGAKVRNPAAAAGTDRAGLAAAEHE